MKAVHGRFWGAVVLSSMLMASSTIATRSVAATAPAGADVKSGVDAWAKGDFARAVGVWRPLAIAGDPDAQFNLAQAYKLGRGVPLDLTLAESWFRKAAMQGHVQAEDNYGLALFQSGKKTEALPWLEKSAVRGEPRTQLVLGTMLFNGDGVPRDFPRAYALMSRASASGLQSASQTLTQMDQYISPADREKGTALAQHYALQAQASPSSASRATVGVAAVPAARTPAMPRPTRLPASSLPARVPGPVREPAISTPPPPKTEPVRSEPAKRSTIKPAAAAKPVNTKPVTKPAAVRASGNWRVQLGAFRDQANAETLWNRVRGKLRGAQPSYPKAGTVTRLQAGGFATKADATRACAQVGVPCVIVAP